MLPERKTSVRARLERLARASLRTRAAESCRKSTTDESTPYCRRPARRQAGAPKKTRLNLGILFYTFPAMTRPAILCLLALLLAKPSAMPITSKTPSRTNTKTRSLRSTLHSPHVTRNLIQPATRSMSNPARVGSFTAESMSKS